MKNLWSSVCLIILPCLWVIGACNIPKAVYPLIHDITPPTFLYAESTSPRTLVLRYSEPVTLEFRHVRSEPIKVETIQSEEGIVTLLFEEDTLPGKTYKVEIIVYDEGRNSLHSIIPFYGFNPHIPELMITEFTVEGNNTTRPETMEVLVLKGGNLAGVTVETTGYRWRSICILPEISVETGDFILIHFRRTGNPTEINETISPDTSNGPNTHPLAWDLWVPDTTGLSATNGAISLMGSPRGAILDGVIYSRGASGTFEGFGSQEVLDHAEKIINSGLWVAPEAHSSYAINPTGSTTTRSIARKHTSVGYLQTGTAEDWYITHTGGVSFGEHNALQD